MKRVIISTIALLLVVKIFAICAQVIFGVSAEMKVFHEAAIRLVNRAIQELFCQIA